MGNPNEDKSPALKEALVIIMWVVAFAAWVIATGHNFFVDHRYELAELPASVVSVVLAKPLLKTTVELARTLRPSKPPSPGGSTT